MSSLPQLQYYLINAFETGRPGSGNQAAVVVFPTSSDPRANDDQYLQTTAQNFGFSETAYLVPLDPKSGNWGLRWFTIEVEVPICGHATLAAAKVIFTLYPNLDSVTFETRYWGPLVAKRCASGGTKANSLEIEISLSTLSGPDLEKLVQTSPTLTRDSAKPLADALTIQPDQVITVGEFVFVDKSLIVEIAPGVDLATLKPDLKALVPHSPAMTIVTQMKPDLSSPGVLRTHTRTFWMGYEEDPVTGSAHAFITGYYLLTPASNRIPQSVLADHAAKDLRIDARQLSRRGGKLGMILGEDGMVRLSGSAVEWGKGTLTI